MTVLSKGKYAEHRGCSAAYVSKLLREGKIVAIANGPDQGKIAVEVCDAMLANAQDPGKDGVRARWEREKSSESLASGTPAPLDSAPATPAPRPDDDSYHAARTRVEQNKAALTALDLLEKTGALVSASGVRKAAFELARVVRDALLNIPDRAAPLIAAETDPIRVHAILSDEITMVLNELTRQPAGDPAVEPA